MHTDRKLTVTQASFASGAVQVLYHIFKHVERAGTSSARRAGGSRALPHLTQQ